jgi:hypothetical protein
MEPSPSLPYPLYPLILTGDAEDVDDIVWVPNTARGRKSLYRKAQLPAQRSPVALPDLDPTSACDLTSVGRLRISWNIDSRERIMVENNDGPKCRTNSQWWGYRGFP